MPPAAVFFGRTGRGARRRLQLRLHRRDLPVQQPGRGLVIAVALGPLGLALQVVEPLLQLADPVQAGLLLLPAGDQRVQLLLPVGQVGAQPLQPVLAGRVLLARQRQLLHRHPVHGAPQLVDLDRRGVDLHPQPGRGLVDQVDRLVRQEPGGDVPVGQRGRRDQRRVGDLHLVVRLVPALEPAQDRDRVLDRGLAHQHLLEPALEGGVLLDPLAVLVQRGRADHAQLAAGQHRLEHVARVHRALGGAGADHGVQLVDERDDLAVALLDLVQDGLEPLLELAAVLGAGHHRAEVERDQPLAAQRLGHVAGHDPLGQALDDGGLADAGLADQHRVVLGPPGQHLDHAPDLGVPADDRVELAVPGQLGQVDAVLLQRLVGALGVLAGDPGAAADLAERLEQRVRRGAGRAQHGLRVAAVGGQADQQVLGGDVLIAELLGPAGRGADRRQQRAGHLRGAERGAAGPRQPVEALGRLLGDQGRVGADRAQQRSGGAVRLFHQGDEQVQGFDLRAAVRRGALHRGGQRLLALVGQFLVSHLYLLWATWLPPDPATCLLCTWRPPGLLAGRPSYPLGLRFPGPSYALRPARPPGGLFAGSQLAARGRGAPAPGRTGRRRLPRRSPASRAATARVDSSSTRSCATSACSSRDQPARLFQLLELVQEQLDAGQVDALFLRQPLDLAQGQDVPHRVAAAAAGAAAR